MDKKMLSLLIYTGLVLASHSVSGDHSSLSGHQIWKLDGSKNDVTSNLLMDGFVDVLDHSGHSQQVRVMPQHAKKVRDVLHQEGVSYEVLVHDLEDHLEALERSDRARRDVSGNAESCTRSKCPSPLIKSYMKFEEMEWYLKEVNKTNYPKVSLSSLGESHEGRDIWLLHIKSDNSSAKSVWIEGGIHAREWISPAVSFGLIPKLLADEELKNNFDFFISPMANPDGYYYTHNGNRLWRKNRRKDNGKSDCIGVDLNRNWDYYFGVGASKSPCSEVYRGEDPFSEPESNALQKAMMKHKDNLIMVLSLHSFGQDLLYPWGWSNNIAVPNQENMIKLGELFSEEAAKSSGTKYDVVNSAGGLYYASGATDDWSAGVLQTKYVYTLELRDKGANGFLLSSDVIESTIEEVWLGLVKALDHIKDE